MSDDQIIDEIDCELFRLMRKTEWLTQTWRKAEYTELYMAIQSARGLSYALLPKERREQFEKAIVRAEQALGKELDDSNRTN